MSLGRKHQDRIKWNSDEAVYWTGRSTLFHGQTKPSLQAWANFTTLYEWEHWLQVHRLEPQLSHLRRAFPRLEQSSPAFLVPPFVRPLTYLRLIPVLLHLFDVVALKLRPRITCSWLSLCTLRRIRNPSSLPVCNIRCDPFIFIVLVITFGENIQQGEKGVFIKLDFRRFIAF